MAPVKGTRVSRSKDVKQQSKAVDDPQPVQLIRDPIAWTTLVAEYKLSRGPGPVLPVIVGTWPLSLSELGVKSPLPVIKHSFNPRHFEELLIEGSRLLDRCLETTEKWRELRAKEYSQRAEFDEFFKLDEIHQEEIDARVYLREYDRLEPLHGAEEKSAALLMTAKDNWQTHYRTWFELSPGATRTKAENLRLATRALSYLAGLPHAADPPKGGNYAFNDTAFFPVTDTDLKIIEKGALGDHSANSHVNALSYILSRMSAEYSKDSIEAQTLSAAKSAEASYLQVNDGRVASLKSELDAAVADAGFKLRRTQAARDIMDSRVRAATVAGGPLNYMEQMKRLEELFLQDFALGRKMLETASSGLVSFLEYNEPIPIDQQVVDRYHRVLLWARRAGAWLLGETALDQSRHVTFSTLKWKPEEWTKLLTSGSVATAKVPIVQEGVFAKLKKPRLRGVVAYVVGGSVDRVWRAEILPPKASGLQSLYIDKVMRRGVENGSGVSGARELRNISPFGEWTLKLHIDSVNASARLDTCEGFELEFHFDCQL